MIYLLSPIKGLKIAAGHNGFTQSHIGGLLAYIKWGKEFRLKAIQTT